ncbi:hypothetical protein ABZW30_41785 [Kitasatospora sp. NPDC004669]|uniref:hypothetical protein n=1 Tax=Kitasatospora sp. NPDC004669 TaxID=3154555 RepID=UPI0033B6E7D5
MKPFTGSSTLLRGGGDLRFGGTGDSNAFFTVFRDTLNRTASSRPDSPCSRLARRILSNSHSRDLCTSGLPDLDRDQQAQRDGQTAQAPAITPKAACSTPSHRLAPDLAGESPAPQQTGVVALLHPVEVTLLEDWQRPDVGDVVHLSEERVLGVLDGLAKVVRQADPRIWELGLGSRHGCALPESLDEDNKDLEAIPRL